MIVSAPFRNPKAITAAPGDTGWHKLANFPPTAGLGPNGRFLVTSLASLTAGGSGSGFWVQMNVGGSNPSDQTVATYVHGNGQQFEFGGGINDLYYKMTVSTDVLVLTYEG